MKKYKDFIHNLIMLPTVTTGLVVFIALGALLCSSVMTVSAAPAHDTVVGRSFAFNMGEDNGQYSCGGGTQAVAISIDLGCEHKGNALVDAMFAIIRFLSVGVGLLVVASLVWAGVQYTSSRGDPAATAKAMERIQSTVLALIVYIFAAAILDYVIPQGFLKL